MVHPPDPREFSRRDELIDHPSAVRLGTSPRAEPIYPGPFPTRQSNTKEDNNAPRPHLVPLVTDMMTIHKEVLCHITAVFPLPLPDLFVPSAHDP